MDGTPKIVELNSITQSAVSQQIRALERRFKVALIERSQRTFSVTAEGRAFLETGKEILRAYNTLGERLSRLQAMVAGELKIATLDSVGLHHLPRPLRSFRKSFPAVRVAVTDLTLNGVYHQVAAGIADVGLRFPSPPSGPHHRKLLEGQVGRCLPPQTPPRFPPDRRRSFIAGRSFCLRRA